MIGGLSRFLLWLSEKLRYLLGYMCSYGFLPKINFSLGTTFVRGKNG
jgi:hypothetical protein